MISICIPAYYTEETLPFFHQLLNSIKASFVNVEDYVDIEIIISDDSIDENVTRYFDTMNPLYKASKFIKYFRNPNPGRSSINLNHAISKATGDIIKPMFCDDYFIYPDTLSRFEAALRTKQWAFCRSEHRESKRGVHVPHYNTELFDHDKGLAEGCNTYGCPSAMAFRKTVIKFDEELNWLMDCEFYTRMQMKYGLPELIDTSINVREWEGQQSKVIAGSTVLQEREYVANKYKDQKC